MALLTQDLLGDLETSSSETFDALGRIVHGRWPGARASITRHDEATRSLRAVSFLFSQAGDEVSASMELLERNERLECNGYLLIQDTLLFDCKWFIAHEVRAGLARALVEFRALTESRIAEAVGELARREGHP